MKVVKFGGTSLATAEQIIKVCDIVMSDPERRLVVVSAPGKRFNDDIKVTDLLIRLAEKHIRNEASEKELGNVIDRYREIADDLNIGSDIIKSIIEDLKQRLSMGIANKGKFTDSLKAAGEDNCAKLVAVYLRSKGFEAHYINPGEVGLLLSDEYGNARVLPEAYDNLKSLKNMSGILVFPGFFGYSLDGDVVTFPRGGSDITGSILAAAVEAEVYENYTDVDSVFAANPRIIPDACPISVLTYREMRELSYAGFSVLHEETLEPVYRTGIPVCIKNTNNPKAPGTMIVPDRKTRNGPVVGIASDKGFCSIYVSKYMMNREIGFGRKLLNILEDEGISYEHTPSGIDNISILFKEKQMNDQVKSIIIGRVKDELGVDDVSIESDIALVMIVGEGMLHAVGIAARATNALANADVNIVMINQGSSEVSMMFGVKVEDEVEAVRALYKEFFK